MYSLFRCFFIFFFVSVTLTSYGQDIDAIFKKIKVELGLKDSVRAQDIFVHFDKTEYRTDEEIWFSLYLLNPGTQTQNTTLHLLLINEMTGTIVKETRHVIEDNKSYGKISIPDSLFTGAYGIVAYTNIFLEQPGHKYFHQSMSIRGRTPPVSISFHTINGTDSIMEARIRTEKGAAAKASINYQLYENGHHSGKIISAIANEFGSIRIPLPSAGQIELAGSIQYDTTKVPIKTFARPDSILSGSYSLPQSISNSKGNYALEIPKLLVDADSFVVKISSPGNSSRFALAVHNNEEMFYGTFGILPNGQGAISIPSINMSPGLATVSLFDENAGLKDQQTILITEKSPVQVSIQPDSSLYHTQSQVKVRIKVTDKNGVPVSSGFSVSCVKNIALNETVPDIHRYINFDRFLTKTINNQINWPNVDLSKTIASLAPVSIGSLWESNQSLLPTGFYDGTVLFLGKPLKKEETLFIYDNSQVKAVIKTNNSGKFILPLDKIRTDFGKRLQVSVGIPSNDYRLILDTPGIYLNKWLAAKYYPLPAKLPTQNDPFTRNETTNANEVIDLGEVIVKTKKNKENVDAYSGKIGPDGSCNDRVCVCGNVNCPAAMSSSWLNKYHYKSREPYNGEQFLAERFWILEPYKNYAAVFPESEGTMITYYCAFKNPPYTKSFDAIWNNWKYYPASPEGDSYNPLKRSTSSALCWEPFLKTDKNGEAVVTFKTNDLKGRFYIIVQGIDEKGGTFSQKKIIECRNF